MVSPTAPAPGRASPARPPTAVPFVLKKPPRPTLSSPSPQASSSQLSHSQCLTMSYSQEAMSYAPTYDIQCRTRQTFPIQVPAVSGPSPPATVTILLSVRSLERMKVPVLSGCVLNIGFVWVCPKILSYFELHHCC